MTQLKHANYPAAFENQFINAALLFIFAIGLIQYDATSSDDVQDVSNGALFPIITSGCYDIGCYTPWDRYGFHRTLLNVPQAAVR